MNKKWIVKNIKENNLINEDFIKQKYNLKNLTAKILAQKNFKNEEELRIFLNPTRKDFYDPYLMIDMEKAIERIIKSIEKQEKILIYGDYDADGITSVTILKRFFLDRGITTGVYIPNRITEGYGVNKEAIEKIANEGYNLIITVDCGITSIKETELAKEKGIDIIITDHHEPNEDGTIPNAIAVVDNKRKESKYPFKELAGCGVAFKVTQALCKRLDIDEYNALKYLDIVTIGTISDIVPLVDENRVITKLGLLLIKQTKNIGLYQLIKDSQIKEINTTSISFGISPRINACGRLGKEKDALELFLTNDPIKARELSKNVNEYNKQRQEIEKNIYNQALEKMNEENEKDKCIILGNENWYHGVIGIVSSKITERFYKPSILISFEKDEAKGSGRSIEGFDLHLALTKCSKYLQNFGGHSMAVGVTLKKDDFNKFKEEFIEYANSNIKDEDLVSKIEIDDIIDEKDVNIDSISQLQILEPFGEKNEEPIFEYDNLKITSIRTLSDGKHLKLNLNDNNTYIDAIGFNIGSLANDFQIGDKVDVACNIGINEFNGNRKIQMVIKDIRKSIN